MERMKKCLVLDLDNTLWGGVAGEDGLEHLQLSLTPPGSGYLAFQQAILDHYHRGVMLALNSRNNPEDALQVTLLRTYRRWEQAKQAPHAYARAVLVNACRERWRHRRRHNYGGQP